MAQKLPFLRADKTRIVDDSGSPVILKGVALGGWLMMEGYMMAGRNIPEKTFKENLAKALGAEAARDFEKSFRDTFITEEDIKIIKGWGANCIRVPFNYRIVEFEEKPSMINEEGLKYLDRVVEWCERNSIYCILDMHAAPGSQNQDWHSDCVETPGLFEGQANRDRFCRLWRFLAERYKDVSAVAGYDVLNEPVVLFDDEKTVKELYDRVTKEIRGRDSRHIIFLEGNFWGQRLEFMGRPADSNTVYSIHVYPPAEYVFNWDYDLKYPGHVSGIMWDRAKIDGIVREYAAFAEKSGVPVYVGEYGINWRGGALGEARWVKDDVGIFDKYDFHSTYWTYKTVANSVFPDGLLRYVKNPGWVNRQGPVTGWENFYSLWLKEKGKIVESWRSENFKPNEHLIKILKKYFAA